MSLVRRADRPRDRPRDRGAAEALGLVLIAPAVIGLAILVVALGRRVDANAQMRSAAESAAQAAALERNPTDARAAADRTARAMLVDHDACSDLDLDVTYPSTASTGLGTSFGVVRVAVTCSVSDRGIEFIQDGPERTTVEAFATVDLFRARRAP